MTTPVGTRLVSQLVIGDGLSAYQVAVKNGFRGTEQQWLLSLRGDLTLPDVADRPTFAQVEEMIQSALIAYIPLPDYTVKYGEAIVKYGDFTVVATPGNIIIPDNTVYYQDKIIKFGDFFVVYTEGVVDLPSHTVYNGTDIIKYGDAFVVHGADETVPDNTVYFNNSIVMIDDKFVVYDV